MKIDEALENMLTNAALYAALFANAVPNRIHEAVVSQYSDPTQAALAEIALTGVLFEMIPAYTSVAVEGASLKIVLREGDAVLAVIHDGKIIAQSGDLLMSHETFITRSIGTLPKGAEAVTIGKFEGQITAITSKTLHGSQLPASTAAQTAAQAAFK